MVIRGWQGLDKFGIICLTGEACVYSLRLLCDLTPAGVKLLEDFFGGNLEIKKGSNWNSQGVASIMLARGLAKELAVFALFQHGFEYAIVERGGNIHGMDKELYDRYVKPDSDCPIMPDHWEHVFRNPGADKPGVSIGGRNIHQMSGRVK